MNKPRENSRTPAAKSRTKRSDSSVVDLSPDHSEVELAPLIDNVVPTRGYQMLPMVGLGGSAGSIQALQRFFRAMPSDSGFAFVVIIHLSSEHESTLAELLQASTTMPVEQVNATATVEPNRVYVIPPGKQLAAADGSLELADLPSERGRRVAVDLFFRTLADTHGPHAAAIVLSGADGDGAIGIKRIKERGGLTIAQDPDQAEHSSMPQESIATGMVDWVLPVEQMPTRLVKYYELAQRIELPPEDGALPEQPVVRQSVAEAEAALREILIYLRTRTGRDFSFYKRATILRRIGRRMQVNEVDDLTGYLAFLRTTPGEARALLQDMLISVTNFFRDREAFEALALQIPLFFKDKRPSDQVRVWVPGCATGEEAYSIAMLLYEHARTLDSAPSIQVFGTDLDEDSIRAARDGIYPEAIAADVSEERLRRWFVTEARGYRVRRELRELVLFALHDVLYDSPFSRLDLLSCRNMMIYLTSEAQSRVLDIFHFALRPHGRLFLGTSESAEDSSLFTTIDKKYRIYEQRPSVRITLPVPVGASALARSLELREKLVERPVLPKPAGDPPVLSEMGLESDSESAATPSELHFKLIERFAPPSVLVNTDHQIIHMSDHAGQFMQFSGGEPTRNLLQLVHPMLRLNLRAALYAAINSQMPAEEFHVPLEMGGELKMVSIRVSPAADLAPNYLLVTFDARATDNKAKERAPAVQPSSVAHHLEQELERTRAQLRDTVEQSEVSTEELRASNEELQAINEELRSATEELESGREELQSVNEELTTVNQELKTKVDELGQANSDLYMLMAATAIATIFLDRNLRIMRYTPPAVELFSLIPTDVGRPLTDLTHQLEYPEMVRDAQRALGELIPSEREVKAASRWFIARTLPYKTTDDRIGGVVLTFVDITHRREAEDALRELQQEQAADLTAMLRLQELSARLLSATEMPSLVKQLMDGTVEMQGADFACVQLYNRTTRRLEMAAHRGFDAGVLDRFSSMALNEPSAAARAINRRERVIIPDVEADENYQLLREFAAQAGYRAVYSTPLFDRNDQPLGVLTTHFRTPYQPTDREVRLTELYARQAADVIALKLAEQTLRISEEGFRAVVEQTALGVARTDLTGRLTFANQGLCEMLSRSAQELTRLRWQDIAHKNDVQANEKLFARLARDGSPFQVEMRFMRRDGSHVPVSVGASVLRDRSGRPNAASLLVFDLTERNRASDAMRESQERLRLVLENARDFAIFAMDLQRNIVSWNIGAERLLGYSEAEAIGQPGDIIFTAEDRAMGAPEAEARTALTEGRSADERWHLRKDGSRFWGSGSMMAMHDAHGQTVGLLKIFRDQTEVREAAEEIGRSRAELEHALRLNRAARDELESASRAKDHFLAVLSHELRTPLTPVVMAVQALIRRTDLPEPAREALDMIRRNVKVESHLIDDLLDLTRITRGHLEIIPEPMDLHAAVKGALEICEADLRGRNQRLVVSLDATQHRSQGDFNRLQQVVWNLVKNASKFTRSGGEITVSTENRNDDFVLIVSDNGIGIDREALPTIFDAFTQGGEWIAREFGGLGLGLAISKATIEAHGGTITAESSGRGHGATFTVHLPLTQAVNDRFTDAEGQQ